MHAKKFSMSQNVLFVNVLALLLHLRFNEITANECGTVEFIDPKVVRGSQTVRGAWPFLAALYYTEKSKFFCGATLISSKNVLTGTRYTLNLLFFLSKCNLYVKKITAAHCVQQKNSVVKLAPEGCLFLFVQLLFNQKSSTKF